MLDPGSSALRGVAEREIGRNSARHDACGSAILESTSHASLAARHLHLPSVQRKAQRKNSLFMRNQGGALNCGN